MRHGGRQRLQDGVDHGRQRDAPQPERRRRLGAEHGALRQHHFERAEAALVDVEIGRGQRLERDARAGDAAAAAGIERARHLRVHLGEIDRHLRAAHAHLDLDAQRLVERAAVVVEEAFGLVVAVGNLLDHGARRRFGLVPHLGDAGLDRLAAVARDQFGVAPRAELAGRDLRAHVAQRRVRIAGVVADDLPQRLVALAGLVDLQRAHLDAFGIDVARAVGAEALPHAADVDPVGAVGGEADQLAAVEARRIEHDVVEMLAADLALVHDDDVARREAVEAVALDAVGDRDAEIGEEDRQAAAVLRDHPRLGVDQPAAIVADLVDHHVVGGLGQRVRHLVGIGDDGVAHHLDGDRMGFVAGHSFTSMMRWPASDMVATSPGWMKRGGVRLLDHGRPFDACAGGQRRPPDDAGANRLCRHR